MATSSRGADPNLAAKMATTDRLDQLIIPAFYLYRGNDVLSPVGNSYAQENVLPNIQFFYPDECGHQGQTDRPDLLKAVFQEFFRDGHRLGHERKAAGVSARRPVIPSLVES
jgi:pimeloyl-ACP methyl ester carboxylesterase